MSMCHSGVAGKTVTVVVPAELLPGQVLAVRPMYICTMPAQVLAVHLAPRAPRLAPRALRPAPRGLRPAPCAPRLAPLFLSSLHAPLGVAATGSALPCSALRCAIQATASPVRKEILHSSTYYSYDSTYSTSLLTLLTLFYSTQVTAPPKRKQRPSDLVRKRRVEQAREDLRQRQLPSRGWADVDQDRYRDPEG